MKLSAVRGYVSLTNGQKNLFARTYEKHMEALENKKGWEPVLVKAHGIGLKVTFKNGEWLHYTKSGEWY